MTDMQLMESPVRPDKRKTNKLGPACPLTRSQDLEVLESFPSSLLIDGYQRDLGINVASEFLGIERMQLCRCLDSEVIFFYPTVTGSPEFYKQLQGFDWYYPTAKFEFQRAATWIKRGDRVLDIGCGAAEFASNIANGTYTGLEPNFVSEDKAGDPGIRILSETINNHSKVYAHAYDVVCAFQVLEHVADPQSFLTAALACLKPGGLLILAVPSAESYITKIPNFVLNAPPHHFTWWTDKALYHLGDHFQLSILDLAHAPVEPWETRLYWMQRISCMFSHPASSYFSESTSGRLLNMAAYAGAGFLQTRAPHPEKVQGASVVMVAKKELNHP